MRTGTGAIQRNTITAIFLVFAAAAAVTGVITFVANMQLRNAGESFVLPHFLKRPGIGSKENALDQPTGAQR